MWIALFSTALAVAIGLAAAAVIVQGGRTESAQVDGLNFDRPSPTHFG